MDEWLIKEKENIIYEDRAWSAHNIRLDDEFYTISKKKR